MEIQGNNVLWVVQVFLALAFLGAGYDQAVNYSDARRHEIPQLAFSAFFGVVAALVAFGRRRRTVLIDRERRARTARVIEGRLQSGHRGQRYSALIEAA